MLRSPEGLCHTGVIHATTRNRDFNGDDLNKNGDEWGTRESGVISQTTNQRDYNGNKEVGALTFLTRETSR